MAADGRETLTAGVWMEFRNAEGHSLGQAVFADWRGKPLPAVGDIVVHADPGRRAGGPLRGRVISRTFDVQRGPQGQSEVWAFLVVRALSAGGRRPSPSPDCLRN